MAYSRAVFLSDPDRPERRTVFRMPENGQFSLRVNGRWVGTKSSTTHQRPTAEFVPEVLAKIYERPEFAASVADMLDLPAGWEVVSRSSGSVVLTEAAWRATTPEKISIPSRPTPSDAGDWAVWALVAIGLLMVGGAVGLVGGSRAEPTTTTISINELMQNMERTGEPSAEDECRTLAPNVATPGGGDVADEVC